MSRPAVRVGDVQPCPAKKPQEHGDATVTGGNAQVLIEAQPAAYVGSSIVCAGDPAQNAVAQGAATVLIGGKPAARHGDLTLHGGTLTATQGTVLVGG